MEYGTLPVFIDRAGAARKYCVRAAPRVLRAIGKTEAYEDPAWTCPYNSKG